MTNTSAAWIRVPILFFAIFGLMEYFVDSGEQPAFIAYPMAALFMVFILLLLIAIELIVASIENVMFNTLGKEAQEKYLAASDQKWEWTWGKETYAKLLGAKPMEAEQEIILDHNYDGIRELDNKLPPWWVYMFYASIVFCFGYLIRFHVFGDYDQVMEYETEVAVAQAAIAEYKRTAKDLVDVTTVVLLTEPADLNAGKAIYEMSCVACHMPDGGGGIGPNLTDAYWILGGGVKNVFNTISEGGRDGKGMVAWKQSLKPAEMAQVASYVLSFQGTTAANPKAAEGDLYIDPNAAQSQEIKAVETDTIAISEDTTASN